MIVLSIKLLISITTFLIWTKNTSLITPLIIELNNFRPFHDLLYLNKMFSFLSRIEQVAFMQQNVMDYKIKAIKKSDNRQVNPCICCYSVSEVPQAPPAPRTLRPCPEII